MTTTATIESLTADLASANERADREREGREAAEARVGELEEENGRLTASLRAHKGQATRARSEVARLTGNRDKPARAAGPIKGDEHVPAEEKRGRVWDAATSGNVELVFSDGKREIRELGALSIGGDRFVDRPGRGLVLDHEPVLEPGPMEKPDVSVAGFALFDGGGKQVGWCELPEPVTVQRGQRVQIPANSIRF